jgi:hypothetical protein
MESGTAQVRITGSKDTGEPEGSSYGPPIN